MIVQDKEGTSFEAFAEANMTGSLEVIDFMVSAPSREILEQVALASNLMVQDEEGSLWDAPHCDSSWIGYRVVQDAVFSEDGKTLLTPAVFSDEYLVNWRLGPRDKLGCDGDGYELWQLTCAAWALQGVTVQLSDTLRAYELHGVSQIDGKAVQTPLRVWAQ
ncbi:hypothetical protein [Pseudophaeobacter sp.]|uniref:hypothetical protein n=1 Tax=Pseudophaeobacter sp. TaxID=1971739 RepID=UPI00260D030B|nr:hypothetical protein [Pseudophaeobacter sp.]